MAVVDVDEGFLQYKDNTFVYIGFFGSPRFCGLYARDEKKFISRVCFGRGRSITTVSFSPRRFSFIKSLLCHRVSPFAISVVYMKLSQVAQCLRYPTTIPTHTLFFHYDFFLYHYDACFVTPESSHVYFQMM